MSGIYIKGMEMPTSCGFCVFEQETGDGCECYVNGCLTEYQKRPEDCPLRAIIPHGRLIDADAFLCEFPELSSYKYAMSEYTVIPADREDGES